MLPTIQDGDEIIVRSSKDAKRGDLILFEDDEGYPDVMRFLKKRNNEYLLSADAIAFKKMRIRRDSIVGIVQSIRRQEKEKAVKRFVGYPVIFQIVSLYNNLRRFLKEIFKRELFSDDKAAIQSVGEKYQVEAFQYRRHLLKEFENLNISMIKNHIKKESKILVAGSGIGHEAVAIAKMGCQVMGIDISPKMIEISSEKAAKAGVQPKFELMDVTDITIKDRDYAAVIFTPAVYSFIPQQEVRIRMLKKMHQILEPDGKVIFDVKSYRNLSKFVKVSLSNLFYKLASLFRKEIQIEFGDWHTKFLDIHGNFHYSYTKYFTKRQIEKEIAKAHYKILDNIQRLYVIQKAR